MSLPQYYLSARGLLENPLPPLNKGPDGIQTVSNPPSVHIHYSGELASWRDFQSEALEFLDDLRTKRELDRCAHVPIYMDPKVEKLNSSAMTVERIQAGAEITLSGRFFWNALAVTSHIVETLTNPQHGQCLPHFLPDKLAFGDSWIIEQPNRVKGQEPDIVLSLPYNVGHRTCRTRSIGELKFCSVVDFGQMVHKAKHGTGDKFRAILGQVVNYMIGHRLKYAFISNYNETIFFKLDRNDIGRPYVYYSDIIKFDDVIDTTTSPAKITVRLALLYLMRLTCAPTAADWQLSESLAADMEPYINKKATPGLVLSTPLGDPKISLADLRHPELDLESPRAIRNERYPRAEDSPLAHRRPKAVAFADGRDLFGP